MTSGPDRMLSGLLLWTTLLTGILFWLPLVRGLVEGAAYQWALSGSIGGRGTGRDYWFVAAGAIFSLTLLYLGRRGAPRPFHWMLLMLQLSLGAAVIWAAVRQPRSFRFEGASVGIDVSLAWIGPVLFGGAAALCIWWVARDLRSQRPRGLKPWIWTPASRIRLGLAVVLIPAQVLLLRSELASGREALGVARTVWQWFLINRA